MWLFSFTCECLPVQSAVVKILSSDKMWLHLLCLYLTSEHVMCNSRPRPQALLGSAILRVDLKNNSQCQYTENYWKTESLYVSRFHIAINGMASSGELCTCVFTKWAEGLASYLIDLRMGYAQSRSVSRLVRRDRCGRTVQTFYPQQHSVFLCTLLFAPSQSHECSIIL